MLPCAALVLSAGLGTRLDPLTRLVAKPAVPLGERTLVEYVLGWLSRQGVIDVVLNLHHRPATITGVVGDGRHLGLRVRYSSEPTVLGSAGGPRHALPLLGSDPFLLVNGDTLSDFALEPLVRAHVGSGADVTMAVAPNPDRARYNGIRLGPSGEVVAFVPKGHTEETWHFVGVQVAAKAVFASLPDGIRTETVAGFYRDLIAREPGRIRAYPIESSFIDVGTPADYLAAAMTIGASGRAAAEGGASRIDTHSRTIIWRAARCARDVTLNQCIVLGDVVLPSGFRAERAVITSAACVRPGDVVDMRDGVALFALDLA